jgi:hypothetical protein
MCGPFLSDARGLERRRYQGGCGAVRAVGGPFLRRAHIYGRSCTCPPCRAAVLCAVLCGRPVANIAMHAAEQLKLESPPTAHLTLPSPRPRRPQRPRPALPRGRRPPAGRAAAGAGAAPPRRTSRTKPCPARGQPAGWCGEWISQDAGAARSSRPRRHGAHGACSSRPLTMPLHSLHLARPTSRGTPAPPGLVTTAPSPAQRGQGTVPPPAPHTAQKRKVWPGPSKGNALISKRVVCLMPLCKSAPALRGRRTGDRAGLNALAIAHPARRQGGARAVNVRSCVTCINPSKQLADKKNDGAAPKK